MPRLLLLLSVVSLLASGCATLDASYRQQVCQPDAAFATGVNDALAGNPMEAGYGGGCAPGELATLCAAYRDGYLEGLERRPRGGGRRGWTCEVKAFTERYVETGDTEAEAAARVRAACEAKNHPMHCDDVTCRAGR